MQTAEAAALRVPHPEEVGTLLELWEAALEAADQAAQARAGSAAAG